jgi:hypothetical protein
MTWNFYDSTGALKVTRFLIPIGTSLPTNPTDGQMFIFTDSLSAPTYQWQLRYIAAATRWIFIGGTPLFGYAAAEVTTTSTTYVDLGGPSVTFPLAGQYRVTLTALIVDGASSENAGYFSCTLGAAAAADTRALRLRTTTNLHQAASFGFRTADFVAELAAGSTAVARYRNQAAALERYQQRRIEIVPEYVK